MAASTMDCCRGRPSGSAGSGLKFSKPKNRFSSRQASWCFRHQLQFSSPQARSRNRRTNSPASGNWCRTQGGITELPPDTDNHARAYARLQPCSSAAASTRRACAWHATPSSRAWIASRASVSDGLSESRRLSKNRPKPGPSGPPVSQCHAVRRSEGALSSSSCWFENALRASSASCSGSLSRPLLSWPC